MKTTIQIKLTQAEACTKVASCYAADYGVFIEDVHVTLEDNVAPPFPSQPKFDIHKISMHLRSNFTRETKIQAVKYLRDEAKDVGIYIGLGEAKFFIEEILGIR